MKKTKIYQKLSRNYQIKLISNNLILRKVNTYDKSIIYKWSNDDDTRKNSFNNKKISNTEHEIWFKKQIESKKNLFWVCISNNNKIGFIRMEFINDFYKLNYLIAPKFRGMGLAKKMIKIALDKKKFLNKIPIIAQVKKNNLISKKILMNCNFVCTNNSNYVKIFTLKYLY